MTSTHISEMCFLSTFLEADVSVWWDPHTSVRCVFSPLSLKRMSLCDEICLWWEGTMVGRGSLGPGCRRLPQDPWYKTQFHPARLAAALTRRPSRTGLGFAGRLGSVSTEKKPEGHFALETGLDTLYWGTGCPQPTTGSRRVTVSFRKQNYKEIWRTLSQMMWGRCYGKHFLLHSQCRGPRFESGSGQLALGMWSFSHWITREVPQVLWDPLTTFFQATSTPCLCTERSHQPWCLANSYCALKTLQKYISSKKSSLTVSLQDQFYTL